MSPEQMMGSHTMPDGSQMKDETMPGMKEGKADLDPNLKDAYQRVVIAGMKVLYSAQTRQILMKGLAREGDIAEVAAGEVAGIMKTLDDKSGMKIPKQIIIPAGVALLLDVLKFLEDSGRAEVTEEVVSRGMQVLSQLLIAEYKAMGQQGQRPQGASPMGRAPMQQPQQPAGLIGSPV